MLIIERKGNTLLEKTNQGVIVNITVKSNEKIFKIKFSEINIIVFCRSPPKGGKANFEITNELTKIFGYKVRIIEGYKSRNKKIFVEGIKLETTRSILNKISQ